MQRQFFCLRFLAFPAFPDSSSGFLGSAQRHSGGTVAESETFPDLLTALLYCPSKDLFLRTY